MTLNDIGLDRGAARSGGAPLRVLMAFWDGGGNVGPQRALGRELSRQGCDVHVVAHDTMADHARADGATFHRLCTANQFDFAAPRTLDDEMTVLPRDILGSQRFAADVMSVLDAIGPDVFVIDCMLVSTLKATVDRGTRFCVVHHLAWMPNSGTASFMDQVYRSIPGQPATASYTDLLHVADAVLVTSYAAFATDAEVPTNVIFIGPVREQTTDAARSRGRPDRPFVLVGLSSVYQQQDQTLENVAQAVSSLPVDALITTGRGIDPTKVAAGDNVEVRSFVDHDAVLRSCDLVVTHGGLGTALFSAGAGVPVLCLPNGRDQNDNAARIEALGLGRTLAADAHPKLIAATVTDMLGDRRMRAACLDFASRVSRFGDLPRAARLVRETAVVR